MLWSGADLMVVCYDLLLLSGLTAEIKIKKMRSWGNSSEKALNALGSYVKRKRRKNTEILYFSNLVCKDFIILIQGCADDLFESFPFVARIATCNVHHHGNNPGSAAIYPRERSRVMQWDHIRWKSRFDCKWLVGFYQGNWPFAASHSRGTKPPCWRAKVALGQDKQRKLPFKIMYVFLFVCLVPVRLLLSSLAVQLYHVNGYLAEICPNIMKTIWLRRKLIPILQLYGNLKVIFDSNLFNRQLSNY